MVALTSGAVLHVVITSKELFYSERLALLYGVKNFIFIYPTMRPLSQILSHIFINIIHKITIIYVSSFEKRVLMVAKMNIK